MSFQGHTGKLNLVGERFDKLIVVEFLESTPSGKLWVCRCDCGKEIVKMTTQLRRKGRQYGGCRSCERESRSSAQTVHGGCKYGKTMLYNSWKSMRQRCMNPRIKEWKYYGGKGVKIHESWELFDVFRSWALSNGYKPGLSLDRVNSDGNYEPSNCEWVTRSENSRRAITNYHEKMKGTKVRMNLS